MSPLLSTRASLPQLTSTNYASWAHCLELHLCVEDVFYILDSSVSATRDPKIINRVLDNFKVLSIISNHVDSANMAHILKFRDAKECWEALAKLHLNAGIAKKMRTLQDLLRPSSDFPSIAAYTAFIREKHHLLLCLFPSGINATTFATMAVLWKQTTDYQSFVEVFLQSQQDRPITENTLDDALAGLLEAESRLYDSVKDEKALFADKPMTSKSDRPVCSNCHRLGHTVDRCWKLHPELRRTPILNKSAESYSRFCSPSFQPWIVDSGCTST